MPFIKRWGWCGTVSLNLTNLQQQSNAADAAYGLPIGTTYAIAGTESSYGTNLGTIGNIFQVTPDTAQSYNVNGNDPYSVANYFSSVLYNNPNSPGYGNLATSYQLYQNGPNSSLSKPAQYSATSPFAQFLASLGPSGSTSASDLNSSAPAATTGDTGQSVSIDGIVVPYTGTTPLAGGSGTQTVNAGTGNTQTADQATAGAAASGWFSWLPSPLRIGGGFLAIMLILIGVVALVFLSKNSPLKA